MNSDDADLRVDLLIDQVRADPPLGWLGPQETLVAELAQLSEIDWPPDETGDRIAARIAAAAASPVRRASRPIRLGRPAWLAAGATVAAALAVISVVQFAGGPHPTIRTAPQSSGRP